MEGVYFEVEGVSKWWGCILKWRGCIMQSGGGLKVVGVYFEVEGVYYAKWRGSQSGGGVFYTYRGSL